MKILASRTIVMFRPSICSLSCFRMAEESRSSEDLLKEALESCVDVAPPPRVSVEEFIAKSNSFESSLDLAPTAGVNIREFITQSSALPFRFPVQTARVKILLKKGQAKEDLEDKINSSYPLIHERLLPLLATFIQRKRQYGRKKEKELYESMTLLQLVDRLLRKRPVYFYNPSDVCRLRDGTEHSDGFEAIGHSHETPKLSIKDYMSYDEIKLSALMSVSSKSTFINDGNRHNRGVPSPAGSFEKEGVIVGMVGARFERRGVMEWQDCAITPEQNIKDRGYGPNAPEKRWLVKEWGRLWETDPLPTWDEAEGNQYLSVDSKLKLNCKVYKARVKMLAEVLLAEASHRAAAAGLKAYVHVVGLGLGVWQISSQQEGLFVEAWGDALASFDTTHIGHVDFSWIKVKSCHKTGDGEKFPNTDVTLHFSQRPLHAKVPSGTLLVDSYAWDGNSLPGNEFWKGMLSASGDPAAACSSQIAELHNAFISPMVTAENLHIVSSKGIEHISQYAKHFLEGHSSR